MGLDMYLEGQKFQWTNWQDPKSDPHEDGFPVKEKTLRLGYWRKHPNLHGYIVNTFANGVDDCQEIALSAENLQTIIGAVKTKTLPHTEGFYFGTSDGSEDEETIKILEGAINWLKLKNEDKSVSKSVIYRASW